MRVSVASVPLVIIVWATALGCSGVVQVRSAPPPPRPAPVESGGTVAVATEPPPQQVTPVTEGGPALVAAPASHILTLGENHTCLLADGQVRCWGYNKQGSLGVGSGADPADGFVGGIDAPVRQIVAGGYQTCALTTSDEVWCWGANHLAQVGSGAESKSPVTIPVRVSGLSGVRTLAAGDATTCALSRSGDAHCWGSNSHRQIDGSAQKIIARPTRLPRASGVDQIAIGNYHICLLRQGRVECRGELERYNRQLAVLHGVQEISAGWGHSCALTGGSVYCWGSNYGGVLGLGKDANPSADHGPAPVPGISGAQRSLVGSDYHSCVILATGQVACWGSNQGHSFSPDLPADQYQRAHVLSGLDGVDELHVGGVHTCVARGGRPQCWGNDWAGAVRGAAAR